MKTLKELHRMHASRASVDCSVGIETLHDVGATRPEHLTKQVIDRTPGFGNSSARALAVILALEVARLQDQLTFVTNFIEGNK